MSSAWQGLRVKVRGGELSRMGPFTVVGRRPYNVKRNSRGEVTSRSYMIDVRLPDGRTWGVPEENVLFVDGTPPSREEGAKKMTTTTSTKAKAPAKAAPKKAAAKKAPAKAAAKKAPAKKATAAKRATPTGAGTGHGGLSAEDRAKRDETIAKLRVDGKNFSEIAKETGMSVTGVRNAVIRLNA
jgi:hypothetical protein